MGRAKQRASSLGHIGAPEILQCPEGGADGSRAQEKDVLRSRTERHRDFREERHALAMRIRPMVITDDARKVLNYYFALREAFRSQAVLHLAADASRIGGLNRLLGFFSRGDGVGGWAPPQARKIFPSVSNFKHRFGPRFLRSRKSIT